MPAGHHLKIERPWRKKVLAALARLRPMVAELEAMLAEARAEVAELEKEERRTAYLDNLHGPTKSSDGELPTLCKCHRKPFHQVAGDDDD